MFKPLAFSLLLAFGAAAPSAAQDAPAEAAAPAMLARLALPPGPEALPAIVAIERGFFQREGVIVSTSTVGDMGALAASLTAGSTDAAVLSNPGLIAMASLQAPAAAVASGAARSRHALIARRGAAASIAELGGKRVGVVNGSCAAAVLPRLLDANGIDPATVSVGAGNPAQLREAISNGEIDAVFGTSGFISNFGVEAVVLAGPDDVAGATGFLCADALVVSGRTRENEPELAEAMARAWETGVAYIRENPEDAARLLQIYMHRNGSVVTPEGAVAVLSASSYEEAAVTQDMINDTTYNAWGVAQTGLLPSEPSLTAYFAPEVMEQARAAAGVP